MGKRLCFLIFYYFIFNQDCSFKDSAFRVKESLVHGLPKIPAQVIGYEHALKIFKLLMLNEKVANESWSGGMNVTYTYGGKLTDEKLVLFNAMLRFFELVIIKLNVDTFDSKFHIIEHSVYILHDHFNLFI